MTKLLYILPEYEPEGHTHFSYIPSFLEEVATTLDVTLIVERGERPIIPGVTRIIRCSRNALLRSIQLPFFILFARMKGIRISYVHYSFYSAFFASLIFRTTGGKVLYWNCGLPWHYQRSVPRGAFETLVYKLVSGVVTGTLKLADHYAEQYLLPRKKLHVMPNWIDISATKAAAGRDGRIAVREGLGVPEDTRLILFAHRLSERKGAHYLPDIARRLPDATLLVVLGDGPLRNGLERRIENDGLDDKVRFYGWQPHATVLKFMHASDIFIMPSDEEGFPHVLLEAMALDLPFVASAVGGVPEMVDSRIPNPLVPKGDIERFSDEIRKLLDLPQAFKEVWVTETRTWVAQYDQERVAKRFLELIQQA